MLSRDCVNCPLRYLQCEKRFNKVIVGELVYCPNGDAHLVDQ
jgi:hypothetical protein